MGEIVLLELPESLARSARAVAQQTQRSVESVLLEWLDRAATELPVELFRTTRCSPCGICNSALRSRPR